MKNRLRYIVFCFISVFFVAYCNALQLTYIFLLSFQNIESKEWVHGQESQLIPTYNKKEDNRYEDFNRVDLYSTQSSDFISPSNSNDGALLQIGCATPEKHFIFTDIHEAFSSTVYICLIGASLFTLPFITYQILSYFAPTWGKQEQKRKCVVTLFVLIFWGWGLRFVHCYILPGISSFLLKFQVYNACFTITVEAKIISYLYWAFSIFCITSIFFFFIFFLLFSFFNSLAGHRALPIYAYKEKASYGRLDTKLYLQTKTFSNKKTLSLSLLHRSKIEMHRKLFFWISFFFCAIISPPEIFSQMVLFSTFYILFEILLWGLLVNLRLMQFCK